MSSYVVPPRGTNERNWYDRGLHAEADARKKIARSEAGRQALECVEALTRHQHEMTGLDIGLWLVRVFRPRPRLSLRKRLRIVREIWKALR